jgi:predicted O-methyltransferase YrrM
MLAAFALRVVTRLANGEADFLHNGYSFYLSMATSFLQGHGLCTMPGARCAVRVPIYPLFLSLFLWMGRFYPLVVFAQAAVGATLVWLAWMIGRDLFDARTGAIAAGLAAISPYAVLHDTALQDTVLANGLVALAVCLLLKMRERTTIMVSLGAGLALALAVLTTARLGIAVVGCLAWVALLAGSTWRLRGIHFVLVALPVVLLVGAWTVRNWRVVGAPVLTTEAGESLWGANNEWTFKHLPTGSIDLSLKESYDRLTPAASDQFKTTPGGEVGRDRLLARWARAYIAAHPAQTLWRSARKVWSAVSAQYSPARGLVTNVGYALIFIPVHLLAAVGLWRSRRDWRRHAPLYGVLLTFVATTAIFWAHTSHKSYLDVFLFVYAGSVVSGWQPAAPMIKTFAKCAGDPVFWALSKRELRRLLAQYPGATSADVVSITREYRGFGWYKRLGALQIESEFRQLVDWAAAEEPGTVIEIGTANGATLLLWSRVARKRVISIDLPDVIRVGRYPDQKGKLFRQFAFDRPGIEIDLIRANSQDAATHERVQRILGSDPVDLLFIDGDHRLDGVTRDFELWHGLVRSGGRILFHDILPHPLMPSCQVDVLWNQLKDRYPGQTMEIIESHDQGWAGIGILTVYR